MHFGAVSTTRVYDYAIIGAGFAGLSTAYFLAKAGKRGIILEQADRIGAHASGHNAAMFRTHHDDAQITELAIRSRTLLNNAHQNHLIGNQGCLLLSHSQKNQQLTRAQTLQRFDYLSDCKFNSAIFSATDGIADIHGMLNFYLQNSATHFDLRAGCKIQSVQEKNNCVELISESENFLCRIVVNAAGAWAGALGRHFGGTDMRLIPYKRHLFQLRHPTWLPQQAPMIWHIDDNVYFRCADDSIISSACDESASVPGDESVQPHSTTAFTEKMEKVFPHLSTSSPQRVWACQRTFTPDRRPLVGWDKEKPWLFWVAGLGGTGVSTSAALGEIAAKLILH